tara:strand:- start:4998 stop:5516 length:519 start_codon:yes stop_codon:yes gene_type:complete
MERRVTLSTNIPQEAFGRKAKRDLRDTARHGAEYHAKRHLPSHFKPGAASKYGYRPRTKSYQQFKKRLTGRGQPLVFTGRTRDEATDTANQKITATSTRGAKLTIRLSLRGASGRLRLKKGQRFLSTQQEQQLARKAEIEAMTTDEISAIAKAEEKFLAKRQNETGSMRKLN